MLNAFCLLSHKEHFNRAIILLIPVYLLYTHSLLQSTLIVLPSGSDLSSPVRPLVRDGGDDPLRAGAQQVYLRRGRDGHCAPQSGHDCCLLLHQLYYHRYAISLSVSLFFFLSLFVENEMVTAPLNLGMIGDCCLLLHRLY